MRRRGEDASSQAYALGLSASQIRQAKRRLGVARHLTQDARARAAIASMMADIERIARRADAMRLRMNAKVTSAITDSPVES